MPKNPTGQWVVRKLFEADTSAQVRERALEGLKPKEIESITTILRRVRETREEVGGKLAHELTQSLDAFTQGHDQTGWSLARVGSLLDGEILIWGEVSCDGEDRPNGYFIMRAASDTLKATRFYPATEAEHPYGKMITASDVV